jgi:alpha-ketoglutarate-dependent taurine dioxygenase
MPASSVLALTFEQYAALEGAVAASVSCREEHYRDQREQRVLAARLAEVCPAWLEVTAAIRGRLGENARMCLVRNVPLVDPERTLIALTCGLGDLVEPYQQDWSRLVRRISPSTDRSVGEHGVLNEKLHTDGTDWRDPNDLTCLLCVRPDGAGGGRSRLLPEGAIREFSEPWADVLADPLPWAVAEELGGGIHWAPVLSDGGIRWLRFTVDEACRRGAVVSETVARKLGAFANALEKSRGLIEIDLGAGDLLIIDNRRCLHARSPIMGHEGSQRLLLRVKVKLSDSG